MSGRGVRRAGGGYMDKKFLVLLHPSNNIEITNYFSCEPRSNSVFSRNNLPRIKDAAYVINLDDKNSKGTHWVSLFIDKSIAVYFDFFGIGYIPQEVLNKIKDKSITHNIFRIQDNESMMCGFYCITFIEYMLAGKTLQVTMNDKIMYKYFKDKYGRISKS